MGARSRRAAAGGLVLAVLAATSSQGQSASSQEAEANTPGGKPDQPPASQGQTRGGKPDQPPASQGHTPGGRPDPLQVSQRLESLEVELDSAAVDDFLQLDRAQQSQILRDAGLDDPGGSLTDPRVASYLVGQFTRQERGAGPKAIDLEIRSGLLPAADAIALAQASGPEVPLVSALEVSDLRRGLPSVNAREAARLARLQAVVHYLRPYLPSLVPEVSVVQQQVEDERIVVATSGPAEDVIKALGGTAKFMGIPVEVVTTLRSPDQLTAIEASISRNTKSNSPQLNFSTRIDPLNSVVRVIPRSAEAVEALEADELLASYVESGEATLESEEEPFESGAIQGGWATTPDDCTWGFTVGVSGHGGLVTAAHCPNTLSYGWIPTTVTSSDRHDSVDAQLHDVDNAWDGSFENEVNYGGRVREITSRTTWGNMDKNDWVCHEGRETGYTCGQITTKYEDNLPQVPDSSLFVRVEGPLIDCDHTDSGGPWFYGNVAWGIHHGHRANGTQCVFGAINFAESEVGFTVLTK